MVLSATAVAAPEVTLLSSSTFCWTFPPESATASVLLLTLALFLILTLLLLLDTAIAVQPPSSPTLQTAVASAETETGKTKAVSRERLAVSFTKPQRAVTPGQSIVFYKGKEVLGGGIIE